jgi:hypothetical protein
MTLNNVNRPILKEFIEDVHIVGATMATMIAWNGLEDVWHKLSQQYPIVVHGINTTGPIYSLGAFMALAAFGVSRSLVGKGVELDAVQPAGAGVAFPKEYFRRSISV